MRLYLCFRALRNAIPCVIFFGLYFHKGEDEQILALCGRRGWAILTCDRKNRYRNLERSVVISTRVRQFVFSGNLGGEGLAKLLVKIYPRVREFTRENERPFIAVVTEIGNVYLRMDSKSKHSAG